MAQVDVEEVKQRLEALGYESEFNEMALQFAIDKITNHIKNQAHITDIPEGLKQYAIDAVCGEYFSSMRAVGLLEGYDVEQGMKSLKMGDTSIDFDGNSQSQLFDTFISYLNHGLERELLCYRRISW